MRRLFTPREAATGGAPVADDPRWHDLLKSAVSLAGAAGEPQQAVGWALDVILDYCGWPLAHGFLVEDGRLSSSGIWRTDDEHRFRHFIAMSAELRLDANEGLPGRIVATGQPAWIADIGADNNFPRADEAAVAGLVTGAGVPILSRLGVVGVLEFFTDVPTAADDRLLDLAAHIGSQVGVIVDRQRDVTGQHLAEDALRRSEADLAEAQRLAHIGSWAWNVGDDHVRWSAELHRIYGLPEESGPVTFEEYLRRVHPDDRVKVSDAVQRAVETLEPYEHEYRIVWPDGTVRRVHAGGEVTARTGAVASRLGGFCHDVTEQREAEEHRRRAQEELASHQHVLERVARGEPMRLTLEALCRDIEKRWPGTLCSVLTVAPGESALRHAAAPSLSAAFRSAIDGLPIAEGSGACGTAAARREDVVVPDALTNKLTADFVALATQHGLRSVWSHPLFSSAGELLGTFAVYRGVPHRPDEGERQAVAAAGSIAAVAMERALTEQALTAAARVDPLTGLANRGIFLNELSFRLSVPGARTAVLFLDLDGFKWINDSLGHPVGDKLLVEVAWRFEAALDGEHLLARFGGDEFTVLVSDASTEQLDALAESLAAAMTAPFELEGGEFFLSVSIGIATNEFAVGAIDLVRDADAAMYAAKARGRARHAVFDSALRDRALERVTTEAELRRAIERDEFVMHYQPIIRLADGQQTGLESLVRWQHPTRGLLAPDRFIPLAEESGLIIALGQRIIEHVLAETTDLMRQRDLRVGVNVSVVQLSDPAFVQALSAALARHDFPADRLFVEVTETAMMSELEIALETLEHIVRLGAHVLIDDFGTGYSSVARLRELPVAGVKIDQRFSVLLGQKSEADDVLAAITDLGHAMRLDVVVEGIETEAARDRARLLGCDYAQGFWFARPAPVADLGGDATPVG